MKKGTIWIVAMVAFLCVALMGCGEKTNMDNTTTTEPTQATGEGFMDTTPREELTTVSDFFSEAASDLRDQDMLNPENGVVSDTQPDA